MPDPSAAYEAARRLIQRHERDTPQCALCGCRQQTHDAAGRCTLDALCPGFVLAVSDDLLVARALLASAPSGEGS